MRLEFSYSWKEWRERSMVCQGYSPQSDRKYKKIVLRPVAALFLISLSIALLSHLELAGTPVLLIPVWLSYSVAGLFSLLLSWLVLAELLDWIEVRRSWKQHGRRFVYRLEVGQDGILFDSSKQTPKPKWTALSRYLTTDSLYVLCKDCERLAIPKRIFFSEEQEMTFWDIVVCLMPDGRYVVPERRDRQSESYRPRLKQVPLISINGIGTFLRSWKHFADGTSEATIWACFLYLPLFPLRKCRLRVLSELDKEPYFSFAQFIQGLISSHDGIKGSYQLIERRPIELREVLNTYLFTYICESVVENEQKESDCKFSPAMNH